MKQILILSASAIVTLSAIQSTHAQTIAGWNFDSLVLNPSLTNNTSISGVAADVGSGTASGVHASTSTIYSTPAGNGSAKSLSANNWTVNDYFQFTTSTLTFSGIQVSYDQTSSASGPGQYTLQYSTDGSSFTAAGVQYNVLVNAAPNAWSSTTPILTTSFSYNLSSITALNNAANVYFRIVDTGTSSASQVNGGTTAPSATGTDRIDNFVVSVVPEPTTLALAGLGGLSALLALSRKR